MSNVSFAPDVTVIEDKLESKYEANQTYAPPQWFASSHSNVSRKRSPFDCPAPTPVSAAPVSASIPRVEEPSCLSCSG